MFRTLLLLVAASALSLNIGCGKDSGRISVYPVSGKVVVKGSPADGAQVIFNPASEELRKPGMPIPEATTDANGTFELRSYEPKDGAPAGEYNVTVLWADESGSKDRLGNRYLDPKKSGLKATVPEGGGEIPPFELQ